MERIKPDDTSRASLVVLEKAGNNEQMCNSLNSKGGMRESAMITTGFMESKGTKWSQGCHLRLRPQRDESVVKQQRSTGACRQGWAPRHRRRPTRRGRGGKCGWPCGYVHVTPRPWTVSTTRKAASKVAVFGSWLTVSSLYGVFEEVTILNYAIYLKHD